uniref:Uncharacterized protein n=1 Tax=Ciona savignyi TaxID=51511 RepID=H2YX30_CIOSA
MMQRAFELSDSSDPPSHMKRMHNKPNQPLRKSYKSPDRKSLSDVGSVEKEVYLSSLSSHQSKQAANDEDLLQKQFAAAASRVGVTVDALDKLTLIDAAATKEDQPKHPNKSENKTPKLVETASPLRQSRIPVRISTPTASNTTTVNSDSTKPEIPFKPIPTKVDSTQSKKE